MKQSRVFNLNSGYAGFKDDEVIRWLLNNDAVVFYQTIIFKDIEVGTCDYYVFTHDKRAARAPLPLDDRRSR